MGVAPVGPPCVWQAQSQEERLETQLRVAHRAPRGIARSTQFADRLIIDARDVQVYQASNQFVEVGLAGADRAEKHGRIGALAVRMRDGNGILMNVQTGLSRHAGRQQQTGPLRDPPIRRWPEGSARVLPQRNLGMLSPARVQQYFHDVYISPTWPDCPRHLNHPMWVGSHIDGLHWCCERDGDEIAKVGELGSIGHARAD
jgi:hypothetical protein